MAGNETVTIIDVVEPIYKRVQGIHCGLTDIPGTLVILQERFTDLVQRGFVENTNHFLFLHTTDNLNLLLELPFDIPGRSLAGTLCLMFHPSATNIPRDHEEGGLISGKVVLRLD